MSVLFALHSWLLGGSRHIFGCRCQISNMAISFRPVSDADELTLEARSAFDPVKWQIIFRTTIITCANSIAEMLILCSLQVPKHSLRSVHHPLGPFVHLSPQLADSETDIRSCPYGQPKQFSHHCLCLAHSFDGWMFFFRKFCISFCHWNWFRLFHLMPIQEIPRVRLLFL